MSLESASAVSDAPLLAFVKVMSGRRIEQARRRERITQEEFARQVGVGVRWLREIEAGNPSTRLDDHIECAHRLRLTTGHILFPLLFLSYDMRFPNQLVHEDLRDLERRCIDLIAEHSLAQLNQQLTPRWRRDVLSERG